MLRKIGRQLTILNVVISSAILIAMAFLALTITERMIVAQNEDDLNNFAHWFLATFHEVVNTDAEIRFQLPEQFQIIIQNTTNQVTTLSETSMSDDEMISILMQVTDKYADKLDVFLGRDQKNVLFSRNGQVKQMTSLSGISVKDNRSGISAFTKPIDLQSVRFAFTLPKHMETQWKANRYRISVTVIHSEREQSLILVLQNRKEELASFYRLRLLFGCSVSVGVLLIILASLYFSTRAIRPIEHALKQQQAFVAAASHELRTPVAALRANAEVLQDANIAKEYVPYLDSILSVSERMSLFITDLTDMARADAGELRLQRTLVDTGEIVKCAVQWMRPLAEKKNIDISETATSTIILADPDRLRQVLLILLDNAIRYTPSGGHVNVEAQKSSQNVVFSVSDNGSGIPDAQKALVFERFYRLDEARSRDSGGTGLGLSIARQLVNQMEGRISVQDNAGGGSCFMIQFKVAKKRTL